MESSQHRLRQHGEASGYLMPSLVSMDYEVFGGGPGTPDSNVM
jgi:hypothetical protein